VNRHAFAALAVLAAGACHRAPEGRLSLARDLLARGDVPAALALAKTGACDSAFAGGGDGTARKFCLDALAARLGPVDGGSFHADAPDDPTLGAAGLFLLGSHHGESLPGADVWLAPLAGAVGPGADTLRFAVARAMDAEADSVRQKPKDDAARRAILRSVARSIPGACAAYADLGGAGGTSGEAVTADACTEHELTRAGAPKRTGESPLAHTTRSAASLWVATTHALDFGQDRMAGDARVALGRALASVRVATSDLEERDAEGEASAPAPAAATGSSTTSATGSGTRP
jgi:hypothetical protein